MKRFYVVLNRDNTIVSIKHTDSPPPNDEWLPRGHVAKQIPRMVYDMIKSKGARNFMTDPKLKTLRKMASLDNKRKEVK